MVLATAWNRRGMAYRDRDVLESLRDRRVRHMVRFAASTVPYYRDWFRNNGVYPRDIRGADDLAELPVLEKPVVRSNPEYFRSVSRRGRTAIRFSTSGSTGKLLVFYHDRRYVLSPALRPLPEGGAGSVIITNLVNRGTVLLNYRVGDVAALSRDNCSCGRSLRLLENLEGRIGTTHCDDLPPDPAGKFRPVVSKCRWGEKH